MKHWLTAKRLRFWVACMAACEALEITEWSIYYFFVARAVRCNTWRFRSPEEQR